MLAALRSKASPPKGFTLIELLVSITVSSIILLALFQALSQATRSWGTQTKSFSEQRELRSALRVLTDDLNAVIARQPTPPDISPGAQFILEQGADDYESSRLAFFRSSPVLGEVGGEETGDMELVMYAVVFTPSGGASSMTSISKSQKLVKRTFDAQTTLARLQSHVMSDTPIVSAEDWAYLTGLNPGVEVIADSVIRFKATPKRETPTLNGLLEDDTPWNSNGQNDVIPRWLEISLTVTNRAAAQQLVSEIDWQGRGNLKQFITNGTPNDPTDDRETMTLTMQTRLQIVP
jgi:prepilin-type N-terminal cleavage/methylation domain-containing protein